METYFNKGVLIGIKNFIGSTWSGEYGTFLTFIPEFIFAFTNKTIDSYVLSNVLLFIPYIIVSLSILLKKIIDIHKIKKDNTFFILSLLTFILFPILHATSIYGQPDIIGLIFIFLIISLTTDYNFKKIEFNRLLLLFICTYFLLISRRWYLYWIISYYTVYIIRLVLKNKKDIKIIVKNGLIYLIGCSILILITLYPLFKNIIVNDYSSHYVFYLTGGFKQELINQINYLGYINLIIILIVLIYGILNKNYRIITICYIIQYFITILLFTRIQNMGLHHTLILLPIYLFFLYLFIKRIINKKSMIIIYTIIIVMNFIISNYELSNLNNLFTSVSLKIAYREDYKEIKGVSDWLKNNLNNENRAYMIAHDSKYNPDIFRNFYMPDTTISNHLPYGSAILGTHKFPEELLTSKYILKTSPFCNASIAYKYNNVFLELASKKKYKLIKEIDMNNGYKIFIYERIKEIDNNEINLYINSLKEESKQFPGMYEEILKGYIK